MSHHIVVYGKPGCHLCELAYQLLEGLRREFDLSLEQVSIADDPKLMALYGDKIPVVVIDDHTILNAPIRLVHVRAALAGRRPVGP